MLLKNGSGILVDKKVIRFISDLMEWSNGEVYSFRLSDIDETFFFNSKIEVQEFLNVQARERFYDSSLRKGYFDYIDNGETVRYNIEDLKYGKILEFTTEII